MKDKFKNKIIACDNNGILGSAPFTELEKQKSLKLMRGELSSRRTLSNVIKQIYASVIDKQGNEWVARELCVEALWMAERINDHLGDLNEKLLTKEHEENLKLWPDIEKGNWD